MGNHGGQKTLERFKVLKERNLQLKIIYLVKMSFGNEGEKCHTYAKKEC